MHIAFLNPQGNFDPKDSYWAQHPDFGGQLVYVKELAQALAQLGHHVDILTRRICDPDWPEFCAPQDQYPGVERVRILRFPCGPETFLPKESLWPHIAQWVDAIESHYRHEGDFPAIYAGHYADGGLAAALLRARLGTPFTFTAHSLGAQKLDKLGANRHNLAQLDERFLFRRRIAAERVAMQSAGRLIVSTRQEHDQQYNHPAYRGAADSKGEPFAIVPPGVNRDVFSPQAAPGDGGVRARIQAALERDLRPHRHALPLVICSSRLDRKKNHLGLVRAFVHSARLRALANLAIVVRGLDEPLSQYKQLAGQERVILQEVVGLAEAHGLPLVAFPLNDQRELAAAYRTGAARGWVFALSALYEPFGLAPLEAMACGLPAVVTRNGGPSESLLDEDSGQACGVLVDPQDPGDIARGLCELLSSTRTWRAYQRAGLERVQRRYTWNASAQGYERVFAQLLEQATQPAQVSIPEFFLAPVPERDIPLSELERWYLGQPEQELAAGEAL